MEVLLRKKPWLDRLHYCFTESSRLYCSWPSKLDFKKLRPIVMKSINDQAKKDETRAKGYPIRAMIPVAQEVLRSRMRLIQGASTLIQVFPVWVCKFCPEVYVGERGHLIQSCYGYRRRGKNRTHEWVPAGLKDLIVPVETFHLRKMSQPVIKHDQRFDFDRIPAVVELCWQAGADPNDDNLYSNLWNSGCVDTNGRGIESFSLEDLRFIGNGTLKAWETVRLGVQKLLMAYPAKACKYCSEVHIGSSGHKARLCGVFKYQSWRGTHFWEKAGVDDLVPPKVVWRQRPHDPPILLNEGTEFYGKAPVVVDLCSKVGAVVPVKYHCMMKVHGLSRPALTLDKSFRWMDNITNRRLSMLISVAKFAPRRLPKAQRS